VVVFYFTAVVWARPASEGNYAFWSEKALGSPWHDRGHRDYRVYRRKLPIADLFMHDQRQLPSPGWKKERHRRWQKDPNRCSSWPTARWLTMRQCWHWE